MKILDLFSGIGAFSLSFERAGAEIVAHSEIDTNRQKILARHFPNVIQLGAIQNVRKEALTDGIELICGGSPCQNLSVAGNREGLAGTESRLWFEYLRLVSDIRPRWVVWENVPGALYGNNGRDFRTILMGLDECGYHVAWRVFDAQYFGVPQRRRRVFLVGHLGDGSAAKVLFERESHPGNSKTTPQAWQSGRVAGTLAGSGSGTERHAGQANEGDFIVWAKERSDSYRESVLSPTLTKRDKKDWAALVSHRMNPETGKLDEIPVLNRDGSDFRKGTTPQALTKQNNSTILSITPSYLKRGFGARPAQVTTANTLQANNGRGYSDTDEHIKQGSGLRRFTPRECERLQGFPDDWTAGFSDSVRYSALGDSIAVPCVSWITERIMKIEKGEDVS